MDEVQDEVHLHNMNDMNTEHNMGEAQDEVQLNDATLFDNQPELACDCDCKYETLNGIGQEPFESTAECL